MKKLKKIMAKGFTLIEMKDSKTLYTFHLIEMFSAVT